MKFSYRQKEKIKFLVKWMCLAKTVKISQLHHYILEHSTLSDYFRWLDIKEEKNFDSYRLAAIDKCSEHYILFSK